MIDSATSSTLGAALSIGQARSQADFGVRALSQTAEQQQQAVTTLLQGGGNVTETRGQNLNILV